MSSASSHQQRVLHRICPSCDVEIQDERSTCPTCGSKLVEIRDEVDTLVGTVVDGRFEIRGRLGQGGMGTVYRAWQKSIGREVAIKLIDRSFSRDAMAVRRFLREARLASQLSQPNTVSVFDFGQIEDGRLFIAMELIRGRTLQEVLQSEGAFSVERTVRIGVQICDALEAAHALGIVHRDLKLENVIVLDHPPGRDLLKVLDFGLAKNMSDPGSHATESGIVVGTPRYMSPEASTTGVTGPAADLYSLGVILGELAIGKPLWQGESLAALIAQKLDPSAAIARAPASLRAVLQRLLDPEAARRPSAEQTRRLLGAIDQPPRASSSAESDDSVIPSALSMTVPAASPPIDPTRQLTPARLESPSPEEIEAASAPPSPRIPAGVTARQARPTGKNGDREAPESAPSSGADDSLAPSSGTGGVPVASSATRVPPGPRRWPLVVVSGSALAAIAVIVVLMKRDKRPAAPHVAAPATVAADAAVVAVAPVDAEVVIAADAAAVDAPDTVKVVIETQPAGAVVVHAGKPRTTPFELELERSTKPLVLQAKLAGYTTKKFTIVPDKDGVQVVKLTARRNEEAIPF